MIIPYPNQRIAMAFYRKHLFFCINQRQSGQACCENHHATEFCDYAKGKLKDLQLTGPGGIRVNRAGCLGRCVEGPALVIYPEGVWYTYAKFADIDEIINSHILNDKIVTRLLLSEA